MSTSASEKPAPVQMPKTTVADIMTSEVIVVNPLMTIRDAIIVLTKNRISGAPVVNETKTVLTVVSEGDLLRLAVAVGMDKQIGHALDRLAKTKDLVTARSKDSFTDIYKKFVSKPVHRVIVTDDNGRLTGIVSRSNVLRLLVELSKPGSDAS